jgi:hypothetical protein
MPRWHACVAIGEYTGSLQEEIWFNATSTHRGHIDVILYKIQQPDKKFLEFTGKYVLLVSKCILNMEEYPLKLVSKHVCSIIMLYSRNN